MLVRVYNGIFLPILPIQTIIFQGQNYLHYVFKHIHNVFER